MNSHLFFLARTEHAGGKFTGRADADSSECAVVLVDFLKYAVVEERWRVGAVEGEGEVDGPFMSILKKIDEEVDEDAWLKFPLDNGFVCLEGDRQESD